MRDWSIKLSTLSMSRKDPVDLSIFLQYFFVDLDQKDHLMDYCCCLVGLLSVQRISNIFPAAPKPTRPVTNYVIIISIKSNYK